MRTTRTTTAVVVAVVALTGVSCAAQPPTPRPMAAAAAIDLGGTDAAWTQLMIPMTTQVVAMLELTAGRAMDAELAALATRLGAQYRADLQRLRAILARAGVAPTHEHDGHDLPGMITAADLRAVGQRAGREFDALVVRNLREEMEQSVRLARSEQRSGRNAECTAIAASIERARTASLHQLNAVIRP